MHVYCVTQFTIQEYKNSIHLENMPAVVSCSGKQDMRCCGSDNRRIGVGVLFKIGWC
jgi:hypothetical protein